MNEPRQASTTTILVVDDEQKVRDSVGAVLRDEGFDVAVAGDG
ncbi:MAG: response regulator, partial [Deltaproteobacteria bacterium]